MDGNPDPVAAKAKNFQSYGLSLESLKAPKELEENILFKNLKRILKKHAIEAERVRQFGTTPGVKYLETNCGLTWNYIKKLHHCLKRMLREVINTVDRPNN
jgi:hypothetical protein